MRENQIETRLNELRNELARLNETIVYEDNEIKNGDVYGQQKATKRGSVQEIQQIKNEIIKLENELKNIRQNKEIYYQQVRENEKLSEEYKEQEKLEEKENLKAKEAQRKKTFSKIKSQYKNKKGRNFEKFMNLIKGKSPNWHKIAKYNQSELDFILDTMEGKTHVQEHNIERIRERGKSISEQEKAIIDSNWRNFVKLLQSKRSLKSNMEIEEYYEKGRLR